MKLIRTTFYSGIITIIRIGSGFIAGKAVAIFTGPSGVAVIGAFTNFITVVLTFGNGAINIGVVKYTAEYEGDEGKLKNLFSTAFKISLFCSIVVGISLVLTAPYSCDWIFGNRLYISPIRLLGITIVFYSINSLLISILNGKKQIKIYTIVNTLGSLVGLVLTLALVYFFKIEGALYALVLAQSVVCVVTIILIARSRWFSWEYFSQVFNLPIAKQLGGYSLMAIVSALMVPISQILLRNMIINRIGIDEAGYWQGLMRISDGYLLLITTSLSTYYLPKLSGLNSIGELRKEIYNGAKIILPIVLFGCLVIYYFRFFIINVLYTSDFLKMEALFFWQLIGDFFKMAAFILGYMMLAKAMTKTFIVNEIVSTIVYIGLGYFFVGKFQLEGIAMAFAVTYFFSFIVMIIIFNRILFKRYS